MSKRVFIISALACGALGIAGWYTSQRILCLPMAASSECMLITSGSNLFDAKGTQINSTLAGAIQSSPMVTFGLGGILFLTGLLKPENA